ncbi:MAG: hypothetical protein IIB31_09440, partial [Chloroflexi bacterium]|nr:hypothetical protein [Chloroflexota bacterium]
NINYNSLDPGITLTGTLSITENLVNTNYNSLNPTITLTPTGVIVVNEQGACFDHYQDSSGTALSGEAIGSWDEVQASQASLSDVRHHIAFGVEGVAEARLFRGREQKANRLAWGGLNYVMAPSVQRFAYEIRLEEERG